MFALRCFEISGNFLFREWKSWVRLWLVNREIGRLSGVIGIGDPEIFVLIGLLDLEFGRFSS